MWNTFFCYCFCCGGGAAGPGGAGAGGSGGGGAGGPSGATNGTANTGGGGGGNWFSGSQGSGGDGVVIIRAPSSSTLSVSPGTNATATHPGGDKIATFTVSGTLTIS